MTCRQSGSNKVEPVLSKDIFLTINLFEALNNRNKRIRIDNP